MQKRPQKSEHLPESIYPIGGSAIALVAMLLLI